MLHIYIEAVCEHIEKSWQLLHGKTHLRVDMTVGAAPEDVLGINQSSRPQVYVVVGGDIEMCCSYLTPRLT